MTNKLLVNSYSLSTISFNKIHTVTRPPSRGELSPYQATRGRGPPTVIERSYRGLCPSALDLQHKPKCARRRSGNEVPSGASVVCVHRPRRKPCCSTNQVRKDQLAAVATPTEMR